MPLGETCPRANAGDHQDGPGPSTPPKGKQGVATNGCTNPSCSHLPIEIRRLHNRGNKQIGLHRGCCGGYPTEKGGDGHKPGCPNAKKVKSLLDIFDMGSEMGSFFVSISAKARHVPGRHTDTAAGANSGTDWMGTLETWATSTAGINAKNAVMECGGRQRWKHLHFILDGYLKYSEQSAKRLRAALRKLLSMGSKFGEIEGTVCVKPVSNRGGLLEYMSKDVAKPHFRMFSTNGETSREIYADLLRQKTIRDGTSFGFSGLMLKRSELLGWWLRRLDDNGWACVDMASWNWVLREIQSGEIRLHSNWALPSDANHAGIDFERMNRWARITVDPSAATERDIAVIATGSARRGPDDHVIEESGEVEDPELVSGSVFNPRFRGPGLPSCIELFKSDDGGSRKTAPPANPAPYFPRALRPQDLRRWQHAATRLFDQPEDPVLGRDMIVLHEGEGGMGKSVLAQYMEERMQACVLGGEHENMLYLLKQWIEGRGHGPKIVVVDLSRSTAESQWPWRTLEDIKNGSASAGKYQSKRLRFARPHVVILSNQPPPGVGTDISADRVIAVELRGFAQELENGTAPPANTRELRLFPGVETYTAACPPRKKQRCCIPPDSGGFF